MRIVTRLLASIILIISQPSYSDETKVCFYELDKFEGESFCSAEGESGSIYNDGFDNEIASISIPPGMVLTLYSGINFSGTKTRVKHDINLPELIALELYNKIGSYQVEPAICFYTEDDFQGESTCLASHQKIDLYSDPEIIIESGQKELPIPNDRIKSISIPPGMLATVYKNDNYNPPFFGLTESVNDSDLQALEMSNVITSIKASEKEGINCDQRCVVINNYKINITKAFGQYWTDERLQNKQVLLEFDSKGTNGGDKYSIKISGGPNISISNRGVMFSDRKMKNKFYFDHYNNIDNLAFIIQIKKDTIQLQYMQMLESNLVDISPIISFGWDNDASSFTDTDTDTDTEIIITNHNKDNPLVLAKSILTADTGDKYLEKRDVAQTSKILCAFTPFLNIYNYLMQDTCQQLDGIVFRADKYFSSNTQGKTLHIAGSSSPLKKKPSRTPALQIQEIFDHYMTLTYIDTNQHGQALSLPAVAKACRVSLYSLLNSRQTRQIRPHCIEWTLDIMTDFTLLFGHSPETWNAAFFGRILDSIIRTGNIGVTVENKETGNRLVQSIKEKIAEKNTENTLDHIKTAFDYAQLSYLNYSLSSSSDESPSQIELLPLGIYELLLETFVYIDTPPIIISQGEPVVQNDTEFEIEIIPTLTPEEEEKLSDSEVKNARAMRKKLSETIAQWGMQYQGTHIEQDIKGSSADSSADSNADSGANENNSALSRLLHAGHIVTGIIHRRLRLQRPGEIYVVVKLQGKIIAVVLADRFNSKDEVELVASATLPDYVLFPDRDGTVRGAGTAAVRALARYLQQQGARTLFSEVISQPSARVKQKVGFNFKHEF